MSERDVIERTDLPITVESLIKDLRRIGVWEGTVLFVQSSLSSIGWVCGGAVAVVQALARVLGDDGTLVMPCMSSDCSDPSKWEHPPVPKEWWGIIKENLPAFDKDIYPNRYTMGVVAECFRCWPGTLRSDHPISFAALGKHAGHIISEQPWNFPLGKGSPLEKCCELNADVLLIGTKRNTSLHLSEHIARFDKVIVTEGAPIIEKGKRVWKEYENYDDHTDHFPKILDEFSHSSQCKTGRIGNADSYFFRQRDMVRFGIDWFERNLD